MKFDISNKYSRREFLFGTLKSAGTIAIGSYTLALVNACTNPTSSNDEKESDGLKIDISQAENAALQTVGGVIALASNEIDSKGLFVIRSSDAEVRTFSRECTHQGCTVNPFFGNNATCGCHGSQFNKSGEVTKGPASKPLKEYNANLDGDIITITE
jgi:cytochrome b6-f complex iron-sulfur subunit